MAGEDSWAGVMLPPVELPNRDRPGEALFNDELAKAGMSALQQARDTSKIDFD